MAIFRRLAHLGTRSRDAGYRYVVSITNPSGGSVMQVGGLLSDHLSVHRVALYKKGEEPTLDQVRSL
jgi:hypothetical protein